MSSESGRASVLSDQETKELLGLLRAGNQEARVRLVEGNIRLVAAVASRFVAANGREREDLFQVGCIGLLKAIDRFDFSYNVCFSTYAVPLIMGEIRRHLRDDNAVKAARSMRELSAKVASSAERLRLANGEEPTLEQLAVDLGLSVEQILPALELRKTALSLSEPVGGEELVLEGILADERSDPQRNLEYLALHEAISILPKQEKQVMFLRYFCDKTQMEVAEELGISQAQVSRTEKRGLLILKEKL
ncbi:MAG: sigma-70 family RNA polymerase sigma factor [Clostridia bacterium]|nr:sigma-70 family RNA polymerase sigma factor [Clostridia bacterium]